jgi:hypothetical protein
MCDAYELIFEVHDTNTMVRYDPKFESTYPKPLQRKIWNINQTQVDQYPLVSISEIRDVDCTGGSTGQVEFQISGGQMPYQVLEDGVPMPNPLTELASGIYSIDIVDATGCRLAQEVLVGEQLLLDPKLCTVYENGEWIISVMDENYAETELSFQWSDFSTTTASIVVIEPGWYTVWVTNNVGCTVARSLLLEFNVEELNVESTSFPTEVNAATGKIFLETREGRTPYTVEWAEKLNADQTDTVTANILSSGTTWDHLPSYAFDNSLSTKWLHAISADAFIGYRFPSSVVVNYYAITSADDVPARDPKDWMFQGSSDGVDWVTLDQQNDHTFNSRYQRKGFLFDNNVAYPYYRLYINQNYGDIATQIQELEIFSVDTDADFMKTPQYDDQLNRSQLQAGLYQYIIKDANATTLRDSIYIGYADSFVAQDLVVVQDGKCQVKIENPGIGFQYYWFPDQLASQILHIGETFQPQTSGNYYVTSVDGISGSMSSNVQGFAVKVAEIPSVEVVNDTLLSIIDPDTALVYNWYDEIHCGDPIHVGPEYAPSAAGTFYVSSEVVREMIDPIDPNSLSGQIIRMDAADLNGDGAIDVPAPPTSSLYGWEFTNGNAWAENNWFAFRSNYQNGLGVADFATIWLQRITFGENGYQTILLAYEENPISFPKRAPFEGLTDNIPRHSDATQLYSNDAPVTTLNGTTYLNGQVVDPLSTPNPMEFCVLGTVMTEPSNREIFYTDTHWEGKIGELILYDRPLSEMEMKGVSEFLRKKWISVADLESPRRELQWDGMILDVERDPTLGSKISVFPNPTSGQFNLQGIDGHQSVSLLNSTGSLIRSFSNDGGSYSIRDLPAGMYFVRIDSKDHSTVIVKPIIKF